MKVLCNLFPLGDIARGNGARTGVHRVVENLIRGLAASPQCETSFHALTNLRSSLQYYDTHLVGSGSRFVSTPVRNAFSRHLPPLEKFIHSTAQNRSLPWRALRFATFRYLRLVNPLLDRLPARILAGMDIYHSPFLPVPPEVRQHRRLRRFTTVYDLIPITHPQFFNGPTGGIIKSLVDGLNEEDHAVCISEATRQSLLAHNLRLQPERVFVTPLAAGPEFYPERDSAKLAALRRKINLPPDVPYFLSVCTLETRKNLDAAIRAFARLHRERQIDAETRLVLVGNLGWKTEKIFAALEDAKACRDAILFTGFVPDDDLAALYSGAVAFVYMSWIEGFGLPPLEAMQCGVPVIVSNTSSLPEVVDQDGISLAPDDHDGIAAAMLSLATDPARRQDFSARALARARLFSWDRFIQQNLDAYRVALAS